MDIKCSIDVVDQPGIIKQIVGKGFSIEYKSDCISIRSGDTLHIIVNTEYDENLLNDADYVMSGTEVENTPNDMRCISFGGLQSKFKTLQTDTQNDDDNSSSSGIYKVPQWYIYITHVKHGKNKKKK
jgi:hypothetical protein